MNGLNRIRALLVENVLSTGQCGVVLGGFGRADVCEMV